MLEAAYKYSKSINAKGEQSSTESLIMSLMFEQYKIKKIIAITWLLSLIFQIKLICKIKKESILWW